jgi:hypothetical protein
MSENLTVEEWERALELRTRISDPGLTERLFLTQRSSSNASAAQGSVTQAPDTQPIDRRRPHPRPINLDWNQSYGMRATFPMPVSTASKSQTSSFGYPSIGSSYGLEDIHQEEEDIDQSLIDRMRNEIKGESAFYVSVLEEDPQLFSFILAEKFTNLRMNLRSGEEEEENLIEDRFEWDDESERWLLPSDRSIEIPLDYQRRPLEPQETRIPSQVSEPHAFSRREKQQTLSTYPGLTQYRLIYFQNVYLDPQKWDNNLRRRQVFNTSQVRIGEQDLQRMKHIMNKRYSAMESEWARDERMQQVRQNAIIRPTVEGLPNQLEPILESPSEDEFDNQNDDTGEEDNDFPLPEEERDSDSETDSSDEEEGDFCYGVRLN